MKSQNGTQPCPFCKEEIKTDAVKCKHCSSIIQKQAALSPLGQIMAVTFGGFALLAIFLTFTSGSGQTNKPVSQPSTPPPVIDAAETQRRDAKRREDDAIAFAQACATEEVKTLLVSPSTADFHTWTQSPPTHKVKDGEYMVNGYVDAQNRFGAMVRANWICNVQFIAGCMTECQLFE